MVDVQTHIKSSEIDFRGNSLHDSIWAAMETLNSPAEDSVAEARAIALLESVSNLASNSDLSADGQFERALSMRVLGDCYCQGRGVPTNWTIGIEWYEKAAEAGDAWACAHLGHMLSEGNLLLRRDAARAYELFERTQSLNQDVGASCSALFGLGRLWETGSCPFGQDPKRAESFYRQCVETGWDYPAARRAYALYLLNRGSSMEEHDKGQRLLESAAEAGDPIAQQHILRWGGDIPSLSARFASIPVDAVEQDAELIEDGGVLDVFEWFWVAYSYWYGVGCDWDKRVASNLMSILLSGQSGIRGLGTGIADVCALLEDMSRSGALDSLSEDDSRLWLFAASRDMDSLREYVSQCQSHIDWGNLAFAGAWVKRVAFWANVIAEADIVDIDSAMTAASMANVFSTLCDMRRDYWDSLSSAALARKWAKRLLGDEISTRLDDSDARYLRLNKPRIGEELQKALLYMGVAHYKMFLSSSAFLPTNSSLERSIELLEEAWNLGDPIAGGALVGALVARAELQDYSDSSHEDVKRATDIAGYVLSMGEGVLDGLDSFDSVLKLGEIVVHTRGAGCLSGVCPGGLDAAGRLFRIGAERGYLSSRQQLAKLEE